MALGASLFVRGDGGWSNQYRHYDDVKDPAADIPTVWGYHLERENARRLRIPPRARDACTRERAQAIIDCAKSGLSAQWESGAPSERERAVMVAWLAHGYVRAQRRYSRVIGGACALASLFMEIERECDKALKHAEEGADLTVYANVMRCRVRVVCEYPYDTEENNGQA